MYDTPSEDELVMLSDDRIDEAVEKQLTELTLDAGDGFEYSTDDEGHVKALTHRGGRGEGKDPLLADIRSFLSFTPTATRYSPPPPQPRPRPNPNPNPNPCPHPHRYWDAAEVADKLASVRLLAAHVGGSSPKEAADVVISFEASSVTTHLRRLEEDEGYCTRLAEIHQSMQVSM